MIHLFSKDFYTIHLVHMIFMSHLFFMILTHDSFSSYDFYTIHLFHDF